MKTRGTNLQSIENKRFVTLDTTHAESIVLGLDQSGMPYYAKYNDLKLTLSYGGADTKRVAEIIGKNENTDDDEIQRIRKADSFEEYMTLLPEIADILNTSVTALNEESRDIRLLLAQTYADLWHSDSVTIKQALGRVLDLNYETEKDVREHFLSRLNDGNTPEKQAAVYDDEKRHAAAVQAEFDEYEGQRERVSAESGRTAYFAREYLRREMQRKSEEHAAKANANEDISRKW